MLDEQEFGGRGGTTSAGDGTSGGTDRRTISRRQALKAVGAGVGAVAIGPSVASGQTSGQYPGMDAPDGYRVPAYSEGPRVIYLNDFGGEGDNPQGLIHFLQYVDYLRVEGIASTQPIPSTDEVHKQIDMYAEHYDNYRTHSDFPTPDELRGLVTSAASSTQSGSTPSGVSETAQHIIDRAHADEEDPLYLAVGGSITEVAQAVHEDPSIKDSIRVTSVGCWNTSQDPNARDYLFHQHPDLWWVESDTPEYGGAAYTGTWTATNADTCGYMEEHIHGVGALGDYWSTITPCCNGTGCWQTGDFFTYALLLHGDPDDPTSPSWGGRWDPKDHGPNYWADLSGETIGKWADDYFADFARRLEWGVTVGIDDSQAPTTPGDLSASNPTVTTVDLSWSASTDSGEAGMDHYEVSVDGSIHTSVSAGTTSTTVSGLPPGTTFELSLRAVDAVGNKSDPATTTVSTDEGEGVTAVNAGGDQYTSASGVVYQADSLSEGETTSTSDAISGTDEDALYQTERYGTSFSYDLDVPDGTYDVVLHFAEIYHDADGDRVFDVTVNGSTEIPNLDIHAEVGHDAALTRSVENVEVSGGTLTVGFDASVENAKVSAIAVLEPSGDGGISVGGNQAGDPDGDGLYEDLNGNDRLDNDDVVTYFEEMDSAGIQNNVDAFDYNGNGRIDFDDVVTLFESL